LNKKPLVFYTGENMFPQASPNFLTYIPRSITFTLEGDMGNGGLPIDMTS